jgi:hypothetical protein
VGCEAQIVRDIEAAVDMASEIRPVDIGRRPRLDPTRRWKNPSESIYLRRRPAAARGREVGKTSLMELKQLWLMSR